MRKCGGCGVGERMFSEGNGVYAGNDFSDIMILVQVYLSEMRKTLVIFVSFVSVATSSPET